MATYFFDDEQVLMKIVSDNATISNKQTQELSDGLLNDYLNVTVINDEELLNSEYMAVKSHEGNEQTFDMYRITNVQTNDDTTAFTGIQLAYYELAGYVVEDIRPVNRTVSYVASQLLSGTEWRVGYVEANLPNVTDRFYYLSAKDSFTKLQEIANCEVVFKVEISGQGVTDKWVEIYSQLGDRTLKRFNYGSNALTVEREIGKNDIYTALIGRGKGEEVGDGYGRKLTFEDVVWSTANGNPVNKPKGQKYIELTQATAEYGIKTSSGKVPRIGIVEFNDIEDDNELTQATYDVLVDVARPQVQFKTTVLNIGKTNIGDTVTIHRYDLDAHYETRVYKVVRDKLDDEFTEVTLGDAVTQSSTRKQARFYNTINNLQSNQNELATQVNYIGQTADGKNAINWGNNEPQFKRTGDLWFRDHPSIAGERQMLVWTGSTWEPELDTSDLTKVQREIELAIAQAETDRTEAVQKINQAVIDSKIYADEVTTVSALRTKVLASDVITADMIQSNVSVVDKLFATDANVNVLTAKTAFINSVKAVDISADRITTGTLNASNVNIINLNVSNLVGNISSFIQSYWNGISTSVSIDNTGVLVKNNVSTVTARLKNGFIEFGDNTADVVGGMSTAEVYDQDTYYKGATIYANFDKFFALNKKWVSNGAYEPVIRTAIRSKGLDIFVPTNVRGTLNLQGNQIHNVDRLHLGNTTEGLIRIGADNTNLLLAKGGVRLGVGDMGTGYSTKLLVSTDFSRVYNNFEVEGFTTLKNTLNMSGKEIHNVDKIFMGSTQNGLQLSGVQPFLNGSSGVFLSYNGAKRFEVLNTVIRVHGASLDMNSGTIINQSDRRMKKNIVNTTEDSLGAISRWGFVDYEWIDTTKPSGIKLGLIAQDTPEISVHDAERDIYSIDSSKQMMMNSHAIKQLNQEVETLKKIILEMENTTNE